MAPLSRVEVGRFCWHFRGAVGVFLMGLDVYSAWWVVCLAIERLAWLDAGVVTREDEKQQH
jgi:hypothetical protein